MRIIKGSKEVYAVWEIEFIDLSLVEGGKEIGA